MIKQNLIKGGGFVLSTWIALIIAEVKGFFNDEDGDTNFISILIILGIVIILAGLFIGFKDQIVGQVQEIVDGFQIS